MALVSPGGADRRTSAEFAELHAESPWASLSLPLMALLGSTGVWRSLAALLGAPAVRGSTLVAPIATNVLMLIEVILSSHGGALSLAMETELIDDIGELLAGASAVPDPQNDGTGSGTSNGAAEREPPADIADAARGATRAASVREQLRASSKALGATERLLSGQLGALHTLYTMPASSTAHDPVARTLGSDVGLGALAALLQADAAERAPDVPRYVVALVLRVISSPIGAGVCHRHGAWLRTLVKEVSTDADNMGGDLGALLSALEQSLQPALLLHGHGVTALANTVASLLQGQAVPAHLTAFDAPVEPPSADPASAASYGKNGAQCREALTKHSGSLTLALRAVRASIATDKEACVRLYEANSLAWLCALGEACAALLHERRLNGAPREPGHDADADGNADAQLVSIAEAVGVIVYAILWQISQTELPEYRRCIFATSRLHVGCISRISPPPLPRAALSSSAPSAGCTWRSRPRTTHVTRRAPREALSRARYCCTWRASGRRACHSSSTSSPPAGRASASAPSCCSRRCISAASRLKSRPHLAPISPPHSCYRPRCRSRTRSSSSPRRRSARPARRFTSSRTSHRQASCWRRARAACRRRRREAPPRPSPRRASSSRR